jgi:hypothetical protein
MANNELLQDPRIKTQVFPKSFFNEGIETVGLVETKTALKPKRLLRAPKRLLRSPPASFRALQAKGLVFPVKQETLKKFPKAIWLTADDVGIYFRDDNADILKVYEWSKVLSCNSSRKPGTEVAIVTLFFVPGHEPSRVILIAVAEAAALLCHYICTALANSTEPSTDTIGERPTTRLSLAVTRKPDIGTASPMSMSVDVISPSLSIHGRPVSILKTSRDFDNDVATGTGLNEGSNSKIGRLMKGNRTSVKLGDSRNGRFTKSDDFDRQMQKKRSVSFGENEVVEIAARTKFMPRVLSVDESSSESEEDDSDQVTIDRNKIKKSPQKQLPKEGPREQLKLSVAKALSSMDEENEEPWRKKALSSLDEHKEQWHKTMAGVKNTKETSPINAAAAGKAAAAAAATAVRNSQWGGNTSSSSASNSDSDSDDDASVRKQKPPPRKAPAMSRAESLKRAGEAAKAAAGRALNSGSDSDDLSGSSGSGSDAGSDDSSVTSGTSSDDY